MQIRISGQGKVSKSLTVKREKQDDIEVLHCHLAIEHIEVKREVIDAICNQRRGWASEALYDELGAPRIRLDLRLKDLQLEARGQITSDAGDRKDGKPRRGEAFALKLPPSQVTKIRFELVDNAALMSLRFTWDTAGDEADDCAPILGRDCKCEIDIEGTTQTDLARPGSEALTAAAEKAAKGAKRSRRKRVEQVPLPDVDHLGAT